MSSVQYPICWFKNVFDTEPKQELVSLAALTRLLQRFEVKPQVSRRLTRELERTESAWRNWSSGSATRGKRTIKFQRAAEAAEAAGRDPVAAAREVYERQCADARRNTKKEMRLWSPALFKPGGRRESADVISMSCLVLDYDDGTSIADATEVWTRWYHIVHTTWSHTAEIPKFRVIFPLMDLVPATAWAAVYAWAEARAVGTIDHTKKGIATTFALPTIGGRRWPREAFVHDGELLDPLSEGLVPAYPAVSIPDFEPFEISLASGDPEAFYIEHHGVDPNAWGDLEDDDLWSGGAIGEAAMDAHVRDGDGATGDTAAAQRDEAADPPHAPAAPAAKPDGPSELEVLMTAIHSAPHASAHDDPRELLARLDALLLQGMLTREEHAAAVDMVDPPH